MVEYSTGSRSVNQTVNHWGPLETWRCGSRIGFLSRYPFACCSTLTLKITCSGARWHGGVAVIMRLGKPPFHYKERLDHDEELGHKVTGVASKADKVHFVILLHLLPVCNLLESFTHCCSYL
jgi:hypothetical protein